MTTGMKYNCIFGGGAIRGIAYIGAIKALRELKIETPTIAGSSVGAIFAALYALDYSCEDLRNIFFDFTYGVFKDINFGIGANFALSKGELFLNWLRDLIEKQYYGKAFLKGENKPVKFRDLEKDLYILSSDLSQSKCIVFSKKSTPDMEVATAIRISACFPGLMKPIEHENHFFVDGDLIKSWPLWKTDKNLNTDDVRVLEFRLEGCRECTSIKSPLDYFNAVFSTFNNFCTANVLDDYAQKDKFDYVVIDTKDILLIDFALPEEKRMELVENGYTTTINYFKKELIDKKKKLLPLYQKMFEQTTNIETLITKGKIAEGKTAIYKLLAELHEPLKYIDDSFLLTITTLKKNIEENTKTKSLFTGTILKEKNKILGQTKSISTDINQKIQELKCYIKTYSI